MGEGRVSQTAGLRCRSRTACRPVRGPRRGEATWRAWRRRTRRCRWHSACNQQCIRAERPLVYQSANAALAKACILFQHSRGIRQQACLRNNSSAIPFPFQAQFQASAQKILRRFVGIILQEAYLPYISIQPLPIAKVLLQLRYWLPHMKCNKQSTHAGCSRSKLLIARIEQIGGNHLMHGCL